MIVKYFCLLFLLLHGCVLYPRPDYDRIVISGEFSSIDRSDVVLLYSFCKSCGDKQSQTLYVNPNKQFNIYFDVSKNNYNSFYIEARRALKNTVIYKNECLNTRGSIDLGVIYID